LKLEVIASEDYTGEVNEDGEINPDGDFIIEMTDKQIMSLRKLILKIDEFEGQDL